MGMEAGDGRDAPDGAVPPTVDPNPSLPPSQNAEETRPWAAVVQIITILVIGAVVVVDLMLEGDPVPTIVYGILAGIALGIEPNTIKSLFRG